MVSGPYPAHFVAEILTLKSVRGLYGHPVCVKVEPRHNRSSRQVQIETEQFSLWSFYVHTIHFFPTYAAWFVSIGSFSVEGVRVCPNINLILCWISVQCSILPSLMHQLTLISSASLAKLSAMLEVSATFELTAMPELPSTLPLPLRFFYHLRCDKRCEELE